jgi:hypothetical protein
MLKWAGLDPSLYGLHSPRAGATTEAFSLGLEHHIIDIKGRWKSRGSKFAYLRPTDKEIVQKTKKCIPY